jgi:erythromycin esterase
MAGLDGRLGSVAVSRTVTIPEHRLLYPWLVIAMGAAACARAPAGDGVSTPPVEARHPGTSLSLHPINLGREYRESDFAFLGAVLKDRSIVQLGESIHVTKEFPQVRTRLVRFLHEELGYDVIALEGSAVDAWMAQDLIFQASDRSPAGRRETAERAQQAAWFALWNTEPMLELMEYVVESQASKKPLYLTSFDIQPGNTRPFGGNAKAAIAALLKAASRYAPAAEPAGPWDDAIAPYLGCYRSGKVPLPEQKQGAVAAVQQLDRWLASIAPAVATSTSAMHAAALRRIPETLRQAVELCERVTAAPADRRRRTYQEVRDELNAKNAIAIRDMSPSHKAILWAHHSHVNHNSTGKSTPSMGQRLLAIAGAELYTVGLFAGRGDAMAVDDDMCPPLQVRQIVEGDRFGVESLLAAQSPVDYFIDLSGMKPEDPSNAGWFAASSSRMEIGGTLPTALAKDFHAAIFVHEVHHVELLGVPALVRAAMALRCPPKSDAAPPR